jgi:hypothetical protein
VAMENRGDYCCRVSPVSVGLVGFELMFSCDATLCRNFFWVFGFLVTLQIA